MDYLVNCVYRVTVYTILREQGRRNRMGVAKKKAPQLALQGFVSAQLHVPVQEV
jgi:hypothetical protein